MTDLELLYAIVHCATIETIYPHFTLGLRLLDRPSSKDRFKWRQMRLEFGPIVIQSCVPMAGHPPRRFLVRVKTKMMDAHMANLETIFGARRTSRSRIRAYLP